MSRPWRTLLAVVVGATVVAGAPGAAAARVMPTVAPVVRPAAAPHHGAGAGTGIGAGAEPVRRKATLSMVTLITGDKVRVTTQADGTSTVVPVALPGRTVRPMSVRYRGDRIEVVPTDARPLLRAGRLDPRLFDVAGLVVAGYDDASTDRLPLVARLASGRTDAARAPAGASAGPVTHDSTSALSIRKRDAVSFWRWLTGPQPAEAGAPGPTGRSAAHGSGGAFGAGVEHVALGVPRAAPSATPIPHRGAGLPTKSARPGARGSTGPGVATYGLLVRLLDRNGRLLTTPDDGAFLTDPVVRNLDTNDVYPLQPRVAGLGVQVSPGRYSFGELVVTTHGLKPTSYTMVSRPDFTVGRANLTLTLDARAAREVRVTTQAPDPRQVVTTFGTIELFDARPWTTLVTIPGTQPIRTFATPTTTVTDRPFDFVLFQVTNSRWGYYSVVVGDTQRIPTSTAYHLRNADLGRVSSTYYARGTHLDVESIVFREAQLPGEVQVGVGWFYRTPLPSERVRFSSADYAGDPLRWATSMDYGKNALDPSFSSLRPPLTLDRGDNTERPWGLAGFRPEGNGMRAPDAMMDVRFEPFSPSIETQIVVWDTDGIEGRAVLERRGKPAAQTDDPYILRSRQPEQAAWYDLDLVAHADVPWSRYATDVHGYWKFVGYADDDPHPMSLLNVEPTGDFDLYNRAPAGAPFRLDLEVTDPTASAGPPTSTDLAVSFDDGETWKDVPTVRDSALRWHAIITHPDQPGGYVSLRVKAGTDNGHLYSMTTIRAYGIGPAS